MSTPASNVTLGPPVPVPERYFSVAAEGGGAERGPISAAQCATVFAPLLGGARTDIEKIHIGGKSYNREAAKVVAEALRQQPALTHADLSDCIVGIQTDEALDVLQVLADGIAASGAQISALDFSDNALGVRGIPRIANVIKNQAKLQHLYFNNDGLQAEAVKQLTELILSNYEGGMDAKETQLKTFEIRHNCLSDAGFAALIPLVSKSPNLERLCIATTRVRNEKGEGLAMAKTLLGHRQLTSLALNDNNLGSEAGVVLAQVIAQNPRLRSLNLGDIGVEEDGMEALLGAMTKMAPNTLEYIDLSANELTGESKYMKPLVKIIKAQVGSLKHLKLEDNELKSRGASKLLKALAGCSKLEYLNLTNNHLGKKVGDEVVAFLRAHPTLKHTKPYTVDNKTVKAINFNGNHFSASQVEELRSIVSENEEALETLSENDEDDDEEDEDEASSGGEDDEENEKADADVDALASSLAQVSTNEKK